ncbi:exodeoxyribonuclease III [Myxococcota bacterium]|nr:exodeoxyribonuclease III [Myxococcota bacterium]
MKLISWNVNGIRACERKGFSQWLATSPGDIIGLQEVRAREEQVPKNLLEQEEWCTHIVSAQKAGYSGVGLFCRQAADEILHSIGEERFDSEGRVQIARFGKLKIVNVYFPNGGGKNRDNSRVPYKLDFYRRLFDLLDEEKKSGERILVMGDFNTAHKPIDLARPKANEKTSGFLIEEREELDRWLQSGWTDTFRLYNQEGKNYTWWSNRQGARERNVGWRIDYVLASEAVLPFLKGGFILPEVMGSDHCPLGVELDESILV